MKTAWNIICIMAVANLMALLLLVGFIAGTGRLNADRVRAVREMFKPTIVSVALEEAKALKEQEAAAKKAAAGEQDAALEGEGGRDGEPIKADDLVNIKLEQSEIDRQNLHLLTQHVERLRQTLRSELEQLDLRYKEFEAERQAFLDMRDKENKTQGDEQFLKSVSTLEQMAPKSAKRTIEAMIRPLGDQTLDEGGAERAVRLLDAMEAGVRTQIVEQFQKDDPALAADLLARIEQYGQNARRNEPDNTAAAGEPSGA